MPTFTPPKVQVVPRVLPDSSVQQKGLYKFYKPYNATVQVFLLSDGSLVQNYATPENNNTSIPYPWNPSDPSAPFAWAHYVDYSTSPPTQVSEPTYHTVWIEKMWDRESYITDTEAAILAPKYSEYITY